MTLRIIAICALAYIAVSNYDDGIPATPAAAQAQLKGVGTAVKLNADSAKAQADIAKAKIESVKAPLTGFGQKVQETTEDTKSTLTKIGEFAEEGSRQTKVILTSIGELVQEATSPTPESPPSKQ